MSEIPKTRDYGNYCDTDLLEHGRCVVCPYNPDSAKKGIMMILQGLLNGKVAQDEGLEAIEDGSSA